MKKVVKRLLITMVAIAISSNISLAQSINCNASQIQSQLDDGKSVYAILAACSGLQLSDFNGKNYAGGVIVYLDASRNGTGIVAAKNDAIANVGWSSQCLGTNYVNGQGTSIGSGSANTNIGCSCSGAYCAKPPKPGYYSFYYAVNSNEQGYTDWYLPSIDALTTAKSIDSNLFTSCYNGIWWSSTQVPENYDLNRNPGLFPSAIKGENVASAFSMSSSGDKSITQKAQGGCVRPFRSFGPWLDPDNTTDAQVGQAISIKGSNFDTSPSNNTILFPNGIKVNPQESTGTLLTVLVPAGTHSGLVRVVTNGIQSNALNYTIAKAPTGNPVVNSFSEKVLIVGNNFQSDQVMTVYGENFSLINTVTFAGGAKATSDPSSNQNQFNVKIPINALTGPITVTSSVGHSNPSTESLLVLDYSTPTLGTTSQDLNDVAIDNTETYVVAVGKQGNVIISENDGTSWSSSSLTPSISSANIYSVVFSNLNNTAMFTIWGSESSSSGTTYYQMYNTPSGISIFNPKVTSNNISKLFSTENFILGVKDNTALVYRSGFTNGLFQWSSLVSSSSEIMDFAANDDKVISVGMGTSAYWKSTNSSSTPSFTSNSENFWLNSVIWAENQFVGVGKEPSSRRNQPSMYYSSDGETWIAAQCGSTSCGNPQLGVAYNSDLDLYFSGGHVLKHYYSMDGQNWTEIILPSNFGTHVTQINKIIPSDDGFIVVGNGGLIGVLKAKRPAH